MGSAVCRGPSRGTQHPTWSGQALAYPDASKRRACLSSTQDKKKDRSIGQSGPVPLPSRTLFQVAGVVLPATSFHPIAWWQGGTRLGTRLILDIQEGNKDILTSFPAKTSRHAEFLRRQEEFDLQQEKLGLLPEDFHVTHYPVHMAGSVPMEFKYAYLESKKPTAKSRALAKRKASYYEGVSDGAAAGALAAAERKIPRPMVVARRNVRSGGLLGMELKAYDMSGDFDNIPQTPQGSEVLPGLLCVPQLGNAVDQRIGNKITLKSIVVDCEVSAHYNENGSHQRAPLSVFVALVMDKQTNGAALNGEDVYDDTVAPHSRRVLENTGRFRVLAFHKSTLLPINVTGLPASNNVSTMWSSDKFTISRKLNTVVNFIQAAGAGTVADIKDVSLTLLCWGYETNGNVYNALPTDVDFNFASRVRFVDP